MQSRRVNPSLLIALACLMLIGCVEWGKELLRKALGSAPARTECSEPIPPGARRAASRDDIVNALVPPSAKRGPRVIATIDEVVEACPSFAERMKQWHEQQASARLASRASDVWSTPWTPADPWPQEPLLGADVCLTEVTLHVDTGSGIVEIKLGEPTMANGCVYGYLESGTCLRE